MLLNAIIIGIHLLSCLVLILFILLHAGRGGGLSDMFGGAAGGGTAAGSTVVDDVEVRGRRHSLWWGERRGDLRPEIAFSS